MSLLVTNTPSFDCITHMGALVIDLSVVTHGIEDVGTDWIVEVDRRNWGGGVHCRTFYIHSGIRVAWAQCA